MTRQTHSMSPVKGRSREMDTATIQTTSHPDRPVAPDRTLPQRMEALRHANEVRGARARLKRDLKAGRQPVHELLLHPPECLGTAKVFDLLLAVPKCGRVKAGKVLKACSISPSKSVGGLSPRQRADLARVLRAWR